MSSESELNSPERLSTLCLIACAQHPLEVLTGGEENSWMYTDSDDAVRSIEKYHKMEMKDGIFIFDSICEPLFDEVVKRYPEHYINLFTDPLKCKLTKINLSSDNTKYPIQDQYLISKLFYHHLREINLSGCQVLPSTLNALKYCACTLQSLDLSNVSGLKNNFVFKHLKNLRKLNLHNSDIGFHREHMRYIGSLPYLAWLDISRTSIDDRSLRKLRHCAGTLSWLSVHHCVFLVDELELQNLFSKLSKLVHLDISRIPNEDEENNNEKNIISPVVTSSMMETFASMPNLMFLDISGAVNLTAHDLIAFSKRDNKLNYLGLSQTGLSYHSNLPAHRITGEANEEQILNSLEVYCNRAKYISFSLRRLFNLACHHNCHQIERCAKTIMKAMKTFKYDNGIHVAAMATLYHISRICSADQGVSLRRELVVAILDSMENLKGVLQLQKNACLTLCNFKIPNDVEFVYFRVADLLLSALRNHQDDYLREIAIMLFNAIVCQNAGSQKKEVGLRGAIKTVMQVIREKVSVCEADRLMDTCWSSLWNITDETPENCKDFLDNGGMILFVDCLNLFPRSLELHRNMMGLMGNVAEVENLRPYLMKEEYIQLFLSLLSNDPARLEVSYNSCGLLSHMLSDGPDAWNVPSILREECMQKLIDCINKWELKSSRNINYRSFIPILCLVDCFHAPAAQHWACWALANLTSVSPDKYCKLVVEEDGMGKLLLVVNSEVTISETKFLAQTVIANCHRELSY